MAGMRDNLLMAMVINVSLCACIAFGTSSHAPYTDDILLLEESSRDLNATELYKLGRYYLGMGHILDAIAFTTARLSLSQSRCFEDDSASAISGVAYFALLARIAAADMTGSRKVTHNKSPMFSGVSTLDRLARVVTTVIEAGGNPSGCNIESSALLEDSLEAYFQTRFLGAQPEFELGVVDASMVISDDCDLTPLLERAMLICHLSRSQHDAAGARVRKLLTGGLPLYRVTKGDEDAYFGDPLLSLTLADACVQIAARNLEASLAGIAGSDRIHVVRKLLDAYNRLRDFDKADSLLQTSGCYSDFREYEGWISWYRGDKTKAGVIWDQCEVKGGFDTQLSLLSLYLMDDRLMGRSEAVVSRLLDSLGYAVRRNLLATWDGRKLINRTYSAIADYFIKAEQFDSASLYYSLALVDNLPARLEYYSPEFCSSYFLAHTFCKHFNFVQEAFEGWRSFSESYPVATTVIAPLETVILCLTRSHINY